jgi:hypothetical protein
MVSGKSDDMPSKELTCKRGRSIFEVEVHELCLLYGLVTENSANLRKTGGLKEIRLSRKSKLSILLGIIAQKFPTLYEKNQNL